jgi:DNA-binding beta-propeller fold protein YncE
MSRRSAVLFAALVVGGRIFLGITGDDRGPSLWQRLQAKAAPKSAKVLRRVQTFDLPGPPGKRFDYLTIDYSRQLLFSSHLGAGQLYVIDLRSNTVAHTIPDLPGIEAVEVASDVNKAYTSDWGENKIGVIDLQQLKVIKKLATDEKPDGIAYAAPFHKIYVSDERGKAEAVLDVTRDEIIATLHFDSETGMPQYDPVSRRVFVNLQDKDLLAEIDPATDSVVARYSVGPCRGNHGMTLDSEHRRVFLSCEGNDMMTVFDLERHRAITSLPMPKGADVIKFDPGLGRIYVACGSGFIAVFQQDDADHYRKLGDFPVEKKVHSIALDIKTHKLYAPEEQSQGRSVARMAIYDAVRSEEP